MHGKVLEISTSSLNKDTSVVVNNRHGGLNQRWYLGADLIIRSALNDMTFKSKGKYISIFLIYIIQHGIMIQYVQIQNI